MDKLLKVDVWQSCPTCLLFLPNMNLPVILFIALVFIVLLLIKQGAKSYTMSVNDFKSIFSDMNDSRMMEVTAIGPHDTMFTYMSYPIDIIECYDKKGHRIALKNSPSIEVQFTAKRRKKVSVYFDTIRINGAIITGSASRFASQFVAAIDLNDIEKIELRNFKKGFRYKQ